MNSKQCPNCGSTNIYQESVTIYRCGDCFDKLPTGVMVNSPPTKVFGTSKQNSKADSLKKWKTLITGTAFAWLLLGSFVFTYFQNIKPVQTTLEEEATSISLDPNLDSVEIVPEGEFQYTSAIPDVIGNVYIVGKFTNQSGQSLLMPKFTVSLFNNGNINIKTSFGYAEKNLVNDGESVSFQVLVEEAPSYDHFEIQVTATTIPKETEKPELTLKKLDFKRNQHKEIVLAGKIQNKSNSITNFTRINCLLINKEEKTIDYGTVSLQKEDFLPKEVQNFEMIFSRAKQIPDSYYCETDAIIKENTNP
ncbi:hypothetical protein ND861_12770 [Leptospira sp. 2 VSF19]|uniref:DUF3426 domain-containing protein n=1 Tax=Leptospira soteropolitanensis TaxID=2950025 RepID=A0AAW5VE05_9LEPT|nr:hypothetical protein [Leptospira soteropolitanensis]MCW7493514.1 hypothetical protein [Leptospira soteropolitanensis]MCW7500954.1 hypothetical protein [Leptospira soteropolitanensis]MCW7523366.1 hypothetical protein [Leptospira soteropolitanensis]MCW7527227.1 hypothetical protein [Leptospira soteropolitanensis]MCW7531084.1 hypothetical protein [Leptospira soteropolitanensis]